MIGAKIAPRVPQSIIRRGIVVVLTMSGVALLDKAQWAPLGAGEDETYPLLVAGVGLAMVVLLPLIWGVIRRTQGMPMFGSPTVAELDDPAFRPRGAGSYTAGVLPRGGVRHSTIWSPDMKSLAALLAAALMATMLSLGFVSPAQAACDQYGPCIDTDLNANLKKNPIRAGQKAAMVVRFRAETGTSPRATIRIRVVRKSNGKVVWSGKRQYNDRREVYRTGALPKGRFRILLNAHTRSDRFEDDSTKITTLRVKKRR
jgi:hypothetical protein